VELPGFVNKLDEELENTCLCRINGLNIIRKVSKNDLNPIEGLREFFKMMQQAFAHLENYKAVSKKRTSYLLNDTNDSPKVIKRELIELEKQGTFENKWDISKQSMHLNYIEMLLRLTPDEKQNCSTGTEEEKFACYFAKMKELKWEILQIEEPTHSPMLS
jgi:hypothetical protein